MAKITNLTFTQLNDELDTPAFAYAAGDITVSLAALTGEVYTGLNDSKAVKAVWKLLETGEAAQTTVNVGAADGEELVAFSPVSNGAFDQTTYELPMARTFRTAIFADPTNIVGQ